jgi:hypothetical protein
MKSGPSVKKISSRLLRINSATITIGIIVFGIATYLSMLNRTRGFRATPPGDDWAGAFAVTSKYNENNNEEERKARQVHLSGRCFPFEWNVIENDHQND